MRQQLHQGLVSNTALDHVWGLMGSGHDLHPRLVNVAETLGFLEGNHNTTVKSPNTENLQQYPALYMLMYLLTNTVLFTFFTKAKGYFVTS